MLSGAGTLLQRYRPQIRFKWLAARHADGSCGVRVRTRSRSGFPGTGLGRASGFGLKAATKPDERASQQPPVVVRHGSGYRYHPGYWRAQQDRPRAFTEAERSSASSLSNGSSADERAPSPDGTSPAFTPDGASPAFTPDGAGPAFTPRASPAFTPRGAGPACAQRCKSSQVRPRASVQVQPSRPAYKSSLHAQRYKSSLHAPRCRSSLHAQRYRFSRALLPVLQRLEQVATGSATVRPQVQGVGVATGSATVVLRCRVLVSAGSATVRPQVQGVGVATGSATVRPQVQGVGVATGSVSGPLSCRLVTARHPVRLVSLQGMGLEPVCRCAVGQTHSRRLGECTDGVCVSLGYALGGRSDYSGWALRSVRNAVVIGR